MHTHEYQAKALLRDYGIPIPDYAVVANIEELAAAIDKWQLTSGVLKIQVHAGGRGKGGGVKLARSREELLKTGEALFGMRLVNAQTGSRGIVAHQLLLSPLIDFSKEGYLAITVDRKRGSLLLLASPRGGVDIEELPPSEICSLMIPDSGRLRNYHHLQISKAMEWQGKTAEAGRKFVDNLIRAFVESDALLLEINPLVELKDGGLLALDAKWTLDSDALFRHPSYTDLFDPTQITPEEVIARAHHLSYVSLNGEIGCMVNGAGLAMATMDVIQYYGGTPANFLDVGGGASAEKVAAGFDLLLADPKVKVIFVNIFGGIMNCATLAQGIVSSTQGRVIQQPIVVRMEGNNAAEGRLILSESSLGIEQAFDLAEGAIKAVAKAKGVSQCQS